MSEGNPVAKLPERPEVGYRANNALIGHGDAIVVPADLDDSLEAEPEIVAVIGQRAAQRQPRRGARGDLRLDDRQRRQRPHLAAQRPDLLARQEQRHLQADGTVDRDRRRSRLTRPRRCASTATASSPSTPAT